MRCRSSLRCLIILGLLQMSLLMLTRFESTSVMLDALYRGGWNHVYGELHGKLYDCSTECWNAAVSDVVTACKEATCASRCMFCKLSEAHESTCPMPATKQYAAAKCSREGSTEASEKVARVKFDDAVNWCGKLSTATLDHRAQLKGTIINNICYQLWRVQESNSAPGAGVERGANFLVFSLGYDSPFWLAVNSAGKTRFVEDSQPWLSMQPEDVAQNTVLVKYDARWPEADKIICEHERLIKTVETFPDEVRNTCWDIIVVDAPPIGYNYQTHDWWPGRMQSIYSARALSSPGTLVYVEDCQRRIESTYAFRHLVREDSSISVFLNGHGGYTCLLEPKVR